MKTVGDALERYLTSKKYFSFEGQAGLKRLNEVAHVLGYTSDGYMYGSSLELFIQDNPGAIQAIFDWISKQQGDDWKNKLIEVTTGGAANDKEY